MGQLTQFFQPPLYWGQFEELTRALVDNIYNTQASCYGRPGQSQDGVDIYASTKRLGKLGVQCKRLSDLDANNNPLPGGPISRSMILNELTLTEKFLPELNSYVIATTAKRDASIQRFVFALNDDDSRPRRHCKVYLWFWDDYVAWLNAFPDVQRWYYDQVIQVRASSDQDEIILGLIAMAFHRPAFEDPLYCEQTSDFLDALKDTQRAMRTGELVDRVSRHVIRKSVGGWREVSNGDWRDRLRGVDHQLRTLRNILIAGMASQNIVQCNNVMHIKDAGLVQTIESIRFSCISEVDSILAEAGLPHF